MEEPYIKYITWRNTGKKTGNTLDDYQSEEAKQEFSTFCELEDISSEDMQRYERDYNNGFLRQTVSSKNFNVFGYEFEVLESEFPVQKLEYRYLTSVKRSDDGSLRTHVSHSFEIENEYLEDVTEDSIIVALEEDLSKQDSILRSVLEDINRFLNR